MAIDFESSPYEIYQQFRRIVQLWNRTRDANRVNALYDEIFGANTEPDDYEEDLVNDVFHFVANLNQLGQHPVRMPDTIQKYNSHPVVEHIMATSNVPDPNPDVESDMEGDGRTYPNPLERFRPAPVKPLPRPIFKKGKGRKGRRAYPDEEYSSSEDGDLIHPINHKSDHQYCCGSGIIQPVNAKTLPFF
jgi:hypothetical protein